MPDITRTTMVGSVSISFGKRPNAESILTYKIPAAHHPGKFWETSSEEVIEILRDIKLLRDEWILIKEHLAPKPYHRIDKKVFGKKHLTLSILVVGNTLSRSEQERVARELFELVYQEMWDSDTPLQKSSEGAKFFQSAVH